MEIFYLSFYCMAEKATMPEETAAEKMAEIANAPGKTMAEKMAEIWNMSESN